MALRRQYWEDLEVGAETLVSTTVITTAVLDGMLGLLGEELSIHADDAYAAQTLMGRRVVPGALVHLFASARLREAQGFQQAVVCARWLHLDFLGPVYPDEPFSISRRVVSKEEVDDRHGVAEFVRKVSSLGPNPRVLNIGRENALILRRPRG